MPSYRFGKPLPLSYDFDLPMMSAGTHTFSSNSYYHFDLLVKILKFCVSYSLIDFHYRDRETRKSDMQEHRL